MAGSETKELPPELAHIQKARVPAYKRRVEDDPATDFDRIEQLRAGIAAEKTTEAAALLNIDPAMLRQTLRVSSEDRVRLTPADSEKVARVFDLFGTAQRVLGGPKAASQWFLEPLPGLAGNKPLELLDTGYGASMVEELLGAIEQGNYW